MQNVDQQEITKFEKNGTNVVDPNGSFKPIHLLNPLRLAYILEKIERFIRQKSIRCRLWWRYFK